MYVTKTVHGNNTYLRLLKNVTLTLATHTLSTVVADDRAVVLSAPRVVNMRFAFTRRGALTVLTQVALVTLAHSALPGTVCVALGCAWYVSLQHPMSDNAGKNNIYT